MWSPKWPKISYLILWLITFFLCSSSQFIREDKLNILTSKIVSEIFSGNDASMAYGVMRMRIDSIIARANLSAKCSQFSEVFFDELERGTLWTLKHAQGKPPAGIMRGKSRFLGSYDQCLKTVINLTQYQGNYPDLPDLTRGRYCHMHVPISKMVDQIPLQTITDYGLDIKPEQMDKIRSYSSGSSLIYADPDFQTCLPSICTDEDINRVIRGIRRAFRQSKLLNLELGHCEDGTSKQLDTAESLILLILGSLVSIAIFGTLMDWYHQKYSMRPRNNFIKMATFFSFIKNGQKLLDLNMPSDSIPCLHGVKVISMLFIVIGHGSLSLMGSLSVDAAELEERSKEFLVQFAIQTTPWVDSFFLISGLLASYHILKIAKQNFSTVKKESKTGRYIIALKALFGIYFYRYIRLVVPLGFTLLLGIVWNRTASGPNWYLWKQEISSSCKQDWPKIIFMIYNLYPLKVVDVKCLGHTWYINNDFQFFLLAPFLVVLSMLRFRWIGWALNGLILFVSILTTGLLIHLGGHIPTLILQEELVNGYYEEVYIKPWCRIGPYCIGLVLGDLLSLVGKNFKLNKLTNLVLWLVCIITLVTIILFPYISLNIGLKSYVSVIFGAVHRPLWGLAWAWMIFSMVTGNAPIIEKVFSWPPLVVLSRLTYAVFLMQWLVYTHFILANRTYLNMSTTFVAFIICAAYVFSNIAGMVLALLTEYPTQAFIQLFLTRLLQNKKEAKHQVQPSQFASIRNLNAVKLIAMSKPNITS